eukprot:37510_1
MCLGFYAHYKPYKDYINVLISAIVSALIISSIYSFLTNTTSILVMPDRGEYRKNGIECYNYDEGDNLRSYHTDYCNNITHRMVAAVNESNLLSLSRNISSIAPIHPRAAMCVNGSTINSIINGRYEYYAWNNSLNGSIFYNSRSKKYLYPWVWSSGSKTGTNGYLISDNYSTNIAWSYCLLPSTSHLMSPLDCYNNDMGQLLTYNGSIFKNDETAIISLCQNYVTMIHTDLCLSGVSHDSIDGTYQFWGTTNSPPGLIWKHSKHDVYLHPWDYGDYVNWRIGTYYNRSNAWVRCLASGTENGLYAILNKGCEYGWSEYIAESNKTGWKYNSQIALHKGTCVTPLLEWQCSAYTQFTNTKLSHKFTSFKAYLISLFIFTGIYVLFCIIHDWTLIYYKENLEIVSFLPTVDQEVCLSEYLQRKRENSNCVMNIVRYILFIIVILPEWFVMLYTVYPIIHYFGFKCNVSQKRYKVPTICYISSAWVGSARFWMSVSTMLLLYDICDGFSDKISISLEPERCDCECNYVFHQADYYKLLSVTSIFVVLSIKFLWSWTNEAVHGYYFLYLIKYSLPIKYAHKINPDECSGSMMKEIELEALPTKTTTHSEYQMMDYTENDEESKDVEVESNQSAINDDDIWVGFQYRMLLLVVVIFIYFCIGNFTISMTLEINYYGYPEWLEKNSSTISVLGSIVSVLVYIIVAYALKMYYKTQKQTARNI